MAEDDTLIEKQEELKRWLATGESKTLLGIVLDGAGRLIQKITRSSEPPAYWYNAVVIGLVILLIDFLISLLLGEVGSARREIIPVEFANVALALTGLIAYRLLLDIIFTTLRQSVVGSIESVDDLVDLHRWLAAAGNLKVALFISVVLAILVDLLVFVSRPGELWGLGPLIGGLLIGFLGGVVFYYLFLVIALPVRLSRYQYKLYAADPSSSVVIHRLSGMLNALVYISAVGGVAYTLTIAPVVSRVLTATIAIVGIIGAWGFVTLSFALGQYALAKIITTAKSKKLDEIQAKLQALEVREDIPTQETLEHISKLMDYHDRIKATRNSALDLRAGLNFVNSLLLPLLAFALANLDKILALSP